MPTFNGFTSSETFTAVPDTFFRELLSQIDDAEELRAALYAIWRIEHTEGPVRFLRRADFGEFASGVDKAAARGILLEVRNEAGEFFFLNSPRGRASVEAVQSGKFDPSQVASAPPVERSNVFTLYEQNIGALTPLIADMLREAEREYPSAWFEEAFGIAAAQNARKWKYVEAILKRWKEKGKDERKNREDAVKDFKRYTEGEFAEYFRD
ncbi:MAG: DnaD domain protein [Anaerolineales bacterium]|nr:DnaD domain protein [Anaerolineales bacterium]MCZ2288136.1 DnaD domain protein [Anaerolineales bacterium]